MAYHRTRALASLASLGLLAALGGPATVRAEPPTEPPQEPDALDSSTWDLPPEVPRPDFVRDRPLIPDFLLKDKKEGRYWTGIPAIGWDAEEGVNVGAFFEVFDNGPRDDPLFRTAPYREKIFFGGTVTSEEVWRLVGRYDRPYVADSPYRIRVDGLFEHTKIANYFGIGGDSIPLISPKNGEKYDRMDNYQSNLNRWLDPGEGDCPVSEPNRCTWARYNKYKSEQVVGVFSLERDTFGGRVRPLLGFQVNWIDVGDLTGRNVGKIGGSGKGTQLPTKLRQDCDADKIRGCNGGWDNGVRLGLTYDSRDFEPNPGAGMLGQMVLYLSARAFGSSEDYQRLTFSGSYFHDFLQERDGPQQLIFAGRATYNMFFGNPPFYAQSGIGFTDFDVNGIGGFRTLRGVKNQRYIGKSAVLLNTELRWFFMEGTLFEQHLRPGVALFADTGRSYSGVSMNFADWQYGLGIGFRLAWNVATLVSMDLGFSSEESVFYLDLGTAF